MRRWTWLALWLVACDPGADLDMDGDGVVGRDDCDDDDATVYPGADEVCDGVDNDCDGLADDEDDEVVGAKDWYNDADSDGYGGFLFGAYCDPPPNTVDRPGDCDDTIINTHPGVPEVCDGIDNDCNGLIDEEDPGWIRGSQWIFYRDADEDGYGSAANFVEVCERPEGYVTDKTDCDDSDPDRNPGEVEICDGKDNNCDVEAGLLVDDEDPLVDPTTTTVWFLDADEDGHGSDVEVRVCNPGDRDDIAEFADDCDDSEPLAWTDAPELCDGVDNDCDGLADDREWWDDTRPYRLPIEVTGAARSLRAPPIAVDVDLAGLLGSFGDTGDPVPGSFRLVLQSCAAGWPQVPMEFVDAVEGVFAAAPGPGADTPWLGTLAFRHDEDGAFNTREVLSAGEVLTYALYFSSTTMGGSGGTAATAPAMTVAFAGDLTTISNGSSTMTLDRSRGGLVSSLGPVGGATTGAQTASDPGNGMFLGPVGNPSGGDWISAADDSLADVNTLHQGSMLTVVRAEGSRSSAHGAFDYAYTYYVFNGRPEVYAKVAYVTTAPSHVGPQGTFWSQAVRPWQVDNLTAIAGGGGTAVRPPGFEWVRASFDDDARGIFLGWRTFPAHRANPPITDNGRFIGLAGQDFDPNPAGPESDVPSGTYVLDHQIVMAYPYVGTWPSIENDAIGLLDGASVTLLGAEMVP